MPSNAYLLVPVDLGFWRLWFLSRHLIAHQQPLLGTGSTCTPCIRQLEQREQRGRWVHATVEADGWQIHVVKYGS